MPGECHLRGNIEVLVRGFKFTAQLSLSDEDQFRFGNPFEDCMEGPEFV